MKTLLAILLMSSSACADSLLILADPTARGLAGPVFDRWIGQIRHEGWDVVVREAPHRWARSWRTNDWGGLNWMSNEVARANPDAVQLFGSLPLLMTGEHAVDGHSKRRVTTHQWLACVPGLTFTDSVNHTNLGWDPAFSVYLSTNVPGDGIPDETYGTFVRPVSSIDAAGLTAQAGNFSSGYMAGQPYQPAIDEGDALRRYLTNDIAYRRGGWAVNETGYIRVDGWFNSAHIMATNNSVTWSTGSGAVGGTTHRWLLHNFDTAIWSPNLVTSEGVWARAFWSQVYKSYSMDESGGQANYRRHLFPGFTEPVSLVGSFGLGNVSSASWVWIGTAPDLTVADAIRSSAFRYGGAMPFEYPIAGDLTLPFDNAAILPPPSQVAVSTITTP